MKNFVHIVFISFFYFFVNTFQKNSAEMAHNVPAVYDGLAARIKKCVAFPYPGRQTVAEVLRGNGAKRNDLAKP
jgi:hypothetical protein